MKKHITWLLLILSVHQAGAQVIKLTEGWKFLPADSIQFSKISYNDAYWKSIKPGIQSVNNKLVNVTKETAWFRLKLNLSDSLKKTAINGFFLTLMRVEDADETYFNGFLIGKTGSDRKPESGRKSVYRNYFIPNRFIHFGGDNYIAVRVRKQNISIGLLDTEPSISVAVYEPAYTQINSNRIDYFAFDGKNKLVLNTTLSKSEWNLIRANKGARIDLKPYKTIEAVLKAPDGLSVLVENGARKGWRNIYINGEKVIKKGKKWEDWNYIVGEDAFKDAHLTVEIEVDTNSLGSLYRPRCSFLEVNPMEFLSLESKTELTEDKASTNIYLKNPTSASIQGRIDLNFVNDMYKVLHTASNSVILKPHRDTTIRVVVNQTFSGTLRVDTRFIDAKTQFEISKIAYTGYVEQNRLMPDLIRTSLNRPAYQRSLYKIDYQVKNVVPDLYLPFSFGSQQIAGYLGTLLSINLEKRLLKVDTADIMSGYLHRPGKQIYIGEHAGKYIQTATLTWLQTGNIQLKKNLDEVVNRLIGAQLPDGYLGTYLPEDYWKEWDVWAHKYNLIGLLSYYRATGYKPALDCAIKMGNLLCKTFGKAPGQKDINLSGGHVGMASCSVLEPMVELFQLTGDTQYLAFCHYIIDNAESSTGSKLVSTLISKQSVYLTANAKAYEMLSDLVGLVRLYKITGTQKYIDACTIAWNDIRTKRLYITGTASSDEKFQQDYFLPFEKLDYMGEGCVTTTWIQFCLELFKISGSPRCMDEIERSVYNQLSAAENLQTGCVSYYTPLRGRKPHSCELGSSCCLSSVPRGISYIPMETGGNFNGGIGIFLFTEESIRDTVYLPNKKIPYRLNIKTDYPVSGKISADLSVTEKVSFPLFIRIPEWTTHSTVIVNGKIYKGKPGSMLKIENAWGAKNTISIDFGMTLQVVKGTDDFSNLLAFQRGPQVLAADTLLNEGRNIKEMAPINNKMTSLFLQEAVGALPEAWIGKQAYKINSGITQKELLLTPFSATGQFNTDFNVWFLQKTNTQ